MSNRLVSWENLTEEDVISEEEPEEVTLVRDPFAITRAQAVAMWAVVTSAKKYAEVVTSRTQTIGYVRERASAFEELVRELDFFDEVQVGGGSHGS